MVHEGTHTSDNNHFCNYMIDWTGIEKILTVTRNPAVAVRLAGPRLQLRLRALISNLMEVHSNLKRLSRFPFKAKLYGTSQ